MPGVGEQRGGPGGSSAGSNVAPPDASWSAGYSAGSTAAARPNRTSETADRGVRRVGAVGPLRDVAGERALGGPRLRVRRRLRVERLDLLAPEEREPAQVRADVAVVDVQPVLVERERRGPLGIEPDRRPALGLAELRAGRRQQQLVREPVGRLVGAAIGSSSARPARRRISSSPAVMLPHWSAPPIWSSTPIVRWRCSKSVAWISM